MSKSNSAFSSIQVLFSFFFISVVIISLYGILYVSRSSVEREKTKISHQENLISIVEIIKKDLVNDSTPDSDSLVDSFWRNNGEIDRVHVKIEDLSSKININFFPMDIIQETGLSNIIELLDDYEQINNYVERNGLIFSSSEISSFISPEVFETWFSSYGIANINFSSKIGLEKLSAELMGSTEDVSLFMQKRENLVENKQLIQTKTDFQFLAGVLYDEITPIISLQPQMNIHFIDENVLESLLSYKPYNINGWKNKKERIIEMRQTQEITRDKLNEILEINNSHPVYYALGTKTWFWKIEASDNKYVYQEILFVEPKEDIFEKNTSYLINKKISMKKKTRKLDN